MLISASCPKDNVDTKVQLQNTHYLTTYTSCACTFQYITVPVNTSTYPFDLLTIVK